MTGIRLSEKKDIIEAKELMPWKDTLEHRLSQFTFRIAIRSGKTGGGRSLVMRTIQPVRRTFF